MAKIYLKFSKQPLEDVKESVAQDIRREWLEAQKRGDNLGLIQKSVDHRDGNFLLTFSLIESINNEENPNKQRHTFTDKNGVKNFHETYGNIRASIVEGYGLVDRHTQFLINSGQSELEDRGSYKVLRSLNNLKQETKEKLNDLWKEYNDKHKKDFE